MDFNKKGIIMEPTRKDLYEFIQKKIEQEGPKFIENKIYIEMQSPEHVNPGFKKVSDSEGWEYVQPAWCLIRNEKPNVHCTTFKDKKIVTLNINY